MTDAKAFSEDILTLRDGKISEYLISVDNYELHA